MSGEEHFSYKRAIKHANRVYGKPSILLGNGFSIDYSVDFHYDSLADIAELPNLHGGEKEAIYDALGTKNLEGIADRLKAAAALAPLYNLGEGVAARFAEDAERFRTALVAVVAQRHPLSAPVLTKDELKHAAAFLNHHQQIFTLNYDLLLYWVTMRSYEVGVFLPRNDGFGFLAETRNDLVWSRAASKYQQVHYLHGALHLYKTRYDIGRRVTKLRSNAPLVGQLRRRLANNQYPFIVSEGDHLAKLERIQNSPYLRTALSHLRRLEGPLFIHGMSMQNDDHILEALEHPDSKVTAVYIGVHGDRKGQAARDLMSRAKKIRDHRLQEGGEHLAVHFYRSESAEVWRPR